MPRCDAAWQLRQPHYIVRLGYSGQISSTPDALPPRSLPTTSVTLTWAHFIVPSLCFLSGRYFNGIEELLVVFLPLSDNVSIWAQKLPTDTTNSVCRQLLPPPKVSEGQPLSLSSCSKHTPNDNKVDHQSLAWGLLEPCVLMEAIAVCYGQTGLASKESYVKTPLVLK